MKTLEQKRLKKKRILAKQAKYKDVTARVDVLCIQIRATKTHKCCVCNGDIIEGQVFLKWMTEIETSRHVRHTGDRECFDCVLKRMKGKFGGSGKTLTTVTKLGVKEDRGIKKQGKYHTVISLR